MSRRIDPRRDIGYGYKVVTSVTEPRAQLRSYLAWRGHSLEYNPGQWTVRRKEDGPLTVFASVEDAEQFLAEENVYFPLHSMLHKGSGKLIYRAAYIKTISKHKRVWYLPGGRGNLQRDFTYSFPNKYSARALPRGTVLADAVCLLERVEQPPTF